MIMSILKIAIISISHEDSKAGCPSSFYIQLHSLLNAKIKNSYTLEGNSRVICHIHRDKEEKKILESNRV